MTNEVAKDDIPLFEIGRNIQRFDRQLERREISGGESSIARVRRSDSEIL